MANESAQSISRPKVTHPNQRFAGTTGAGRVRGFMSEDGTTTNRTTGWHVAVPLVPRRGVASAASQRSTSLTTDERERLLDRKSVVHHAHERFRDGRGSGVLDDVATIDDSGGALL